LPSSFRWPPCSPASEGQKARVGRSPITTRYLQEGRGPQGSTIIRIALFFQPFGSAGKLDLAPWLSAPRAVRAAQGWAGRPTDPSVWRDGRSGAPAEALPWTYVAPTCGVVVMYCPQASPTFCGPWSTSGKTAMSLCGDTHCYYKLSRGRHRGRLGCPSSPRFPAYPASLPRGLYAALCLPFVTTLATESVT
jgi:hypothetical protein